MDPIASSRPASGHNETSVPVTDSVDSYHTPSEQTTGSIYSSITSHQLAMEEIALAGESVPSYPPPSFKEAVASSRIRPLRSTVFATSLEDPPPAYTVPQCTQGGFINTTRQALRSTMRKMLRKDASPVGPDLELGCHTHEVAHQETWRDDVKSFFGHKPTMQIIDLLTSILRAFKADRIFT
ncbi:MAG: hypothetical protein Q9159_005779 [Coniocarpon cinnabarinum]